MEKLLTNTEQSTTYPDKETMKSFLEIGQKLNIFEEVISNKTHTSIYANAPIVHTLAILIEECKWDKELKNNFEIILQTNNTESIYRFMANAILDIWVKKHDNDFVRETVKADKQRFEKIIHFSKDDISPIPYSYLPKWYWDSSSTNLIHKKFEAELARLNWINQWADKIQQETDNHKFDRWDNSAQIDDLEKKL